MAPDRQLVDFIDTGGGPLNCVFDGTDLLVTDFGEWSHEAEQGEAATGRLLRIRLGVAGMPLYRGPMERG